MNADNSDLELVVAKIKKWLMQNLMGNFLPTRLSGKNLTNLILPMCSVTRSIEASSLIDWLCKQQVLFILAPRGKVLYNEDHPFMHSLMTSDQTYDSVVLSRLSVWFNRSREQGALPSSQQTLTNCLQQLAQTKIAVPTEKVLARLAELEYINVDESGAISYFGEKEKDSCIGRIKRGCDSEDELQTKKACISCI